MWLPCFLEIRGQHFWAVRDLQPHGQRAVCGGGLIVEAEDVVLKGSGRVQGVLLALLP